MAAHFAAIDAPDIFCHETWDHVGAWIFYISSPVSFLMESDAEIWRCQGTNQKPPSWKAFCFQKVVCSGNVGHQICSYAQEKLSKNLEVLF